MPYSYSYLQLSGNEMEQVLIGKEQERVKPERRDGVWTLERKIMKDNM